MAENPKPSYCGSVSDLPCQIVEDGGGGKWWDGLYDVNAVTVQHICRRQAGEQVRGQKSETKCDSSVLGYIQALIGGGGC